MDFTEPASWAQIRCEAEEFVAEHVTRAVIENERRTGDGVDRALTRKLGERGWIAAGWPVAEGGAGLDPQDYLALYFRLPGNTALRAVTDHLFGYLRTRFC